MRRIATLNATREIMQKHGISARKAFGQNFLIDRNIITKIIQGAGITESDTVLEIGPGLGGLTQELAENAGKVIAVELDKQLIPVLEENLSEYDNVEIVNEDILKYDFSGLSNVKVVANLPYYITTPILFSLLERKNPVTSITVMIQKEVADRLNAKPGTKDYGALTLTVGYRSKTSVITEVSPSCFIPAPGVSSAVIRLDILAQPPVDAGDEDLLFRIIRASFGQRRKTLLNSLSNSGVADKEQIRQTLNELNLDENIRGEALSLAQFAALTRRLSD